LSSWSKTQGVLGLRRRRANAEKKMKVSSCKGCLHHCGENDSALLELKTSHLPLFLIPQLFLMHRSPKPSNFCANVTLPKKIVLPSTWLRGAMLSVTSPACQQKKIFPAAQSPNLAPLKCFQNS